METTFRRLNALVALGRGQEASGWYAPPFHSRLPHPMGGLGVLLDEAAARVAVGAGKLARSEILSDVLGLSGEIGGVTVGALFPLLRQPEAPFQLPADWKRELEEGSRPLSPVTAAALLAACVQERTGLPPSDFLRRQGLVEGESRPAFHRDGTACSAATALTPAAAARLAAALSRFPGWESPGELFPAGGAKWGMWYLSSRRQLAAGYFDDPAVLLSGIPHNPPESFPGSSACPAPGIWYPAGRPLLRTLAGAGGICYPEAGIRAASMTLRAGPPSILFDSEDGEAALRFSPDGYILSRTPDGIYAFRGGWRGGRADAVFTGRIQNLESPCGSVWTLARSGSGWTLNACPEDGSGPYTVRFVAHPFF